MSLLNDASLVFIPSGYKEDKVYSVIPSNGAGDLDFVRGCDATRINPQSLVENTPWNLFNDTEDFTFGTWSKVSTTVTANTTVAPNGAQTADTAVISSGGYIYYQLNYSGTAGSSISMSVYSKTSTTNLLVFGGATIAGTDTEQILSVGNGWYRHIVTRVFTTTASGIVQFVLGFYTPGTHIIWGAQLNVGTIKPYFQTTDRLNVPRLTYENGCPSLLLEKQSINISQFAEVGTGGFLAATVTNGTELLGLKTFKILTDNTAYGDSPYINTNTEYQANTAYTLSFYTDFSKSNGTTISASMLGFFPGVAYAGITINKSTKSITTFNVGGIWTINSYTANQISGEIYRIVVTCTPNATSAGGSRNYINADNTFYAEVCGVQVEASVYPTSYIYKPASTSVTRLRDSCSKTGISSLIGQTEGTLFVDINNVLELDVPQLTIDDGTNNNRIVLYRSPTNGYISIFISVAGTNTNYSSTTSSSNGKIAIAYNNTGFVVYLNGTQILSFANSIPGNMSAIRLNGRATNDFYTVKNINQFLLFKRRLTNTELANLTTL